MWQSLIVSIWTYLSYNIFLTFCLFILWKYEWINSHFCFLKCNLLTNVSLKDKNTKFSHWKCKKYNTKILQNNNSKIQAYMRSSAVVWRWNLDSSSSRTDESVSSDFANLMFPRWRIAATTLKIASWEEEGRKYITNFKIFCFIWRGS